MIHITIDESEKKIRHEYWENLKNKHPYYVCYEHKTEKRIVTKYPECVKAQLRILTERIIKIYQEYSKIEVTSDEDEERLKQNLHDKIMPLIHEKVKIIENSCPTYIVDNR